MTDLVLSKIVFRLDLLVVPKYLSIAISELYGHLMKTETPGFYLKPQNQNAERVGAQKTICTCKSEGCGGILFKLRPTFISRL